MGYFYQDNVNSAYSHTPAYTYGSLNLLTNAGVSRSSSYNLLFIRCGPLQRLILVGRGSTTQSAFTSFTVIA